MASHARPTSIMIDTVNRAFPNWNMSMASDFKPLGSMKDTIDSAFADRGARWAGIAGLWLLVLAICIIPWSRPYPGFPVVNLEPKKFPYFWPSKYQWAFRTQECLAKGKELTDSCFQVRTMAGFKIVLPRRFAEELRSNDALNFRLHTMRDIQTHFPGMNGMKEALRLDGLFADTIRIKFTQALGDILPDMVDEAGHAVSVEFGDDPEWRTHKIKDVVYFTVARTSTRIYSGKEMARNEAWLKVVLGYTLSIMTITMVMPSFPHWIRPVVYRLLSASWKLRRELREAEKTLTPVIIETKKRYTSPESSKTKKRITGENAFAWMMDIQNGRPLEINNLIAAQLGLNVVAVQATTEILTRCLLRVSKDQDLLGSLREEIVRVLQKKGWTKSALYEMELLDSFLSEVQRTIPMAYTSMNRYVSKKVVLSDGTVIPGNSLITIHDDGPRDADVYGNPEVFDAYRSLRKREQPGEKSRHQFVSTTPDTLAFGLGQFSCPGRFFVSQELKVLLVFLLLKYDWRSEGPMPQTMVFESVAFLPTTSTLTCKRRAEEIDLANPMVVAASGETQDC